MVNIREPKLEFGDPGTFNRYGVEDERLQVTVYPRLKFMYITVNGPDNPERAERMWAKRCARNAPEDQAMFAAVMKYRMLGFKEKLY